MESPESIPTLADKAEYLQRQNELLQSQIERLELVIKLQDRESKIKDELIAHLKESINPII